MRINHSIAVILLGGLLYQSAHAFVVYDPTNWVQNAATAANTARQLVKQAEQINLVLKDMKNYDGNVGQWSNIQTVLQQLGDEVQQGQALSYAMQNVDKQFQQKYPGYVSTQDYQQSYSTWSQSTLDTLRGTLDSAGLQASQFSGEQSTLNQLANLSQTAQGRMQAVQVGNMLATQQVAQMQKLRQLVIAQTNAQNAYASYQIQKDSSQEASASQWIKGSNTPFPHYGSGHGTETATLPSIY